MKVFRPNRDGEVFARVLYSIVALSGVLIYAFSMNESNAVFAAFTIALGICGYAERRLFSLSMNDDVVSISRLGIVTWRRKFKDSFSTIDYPFSLSFHDKISGRLVKFISLGAFAKQDVDEMIATLRAMDALVNTDAHRFPS